MANSVSHASIPYPIKNARYTIAVPYLDSTGGPTDPTTPDTELSGDAGAFADCTEEVTTITGSNGTGYITLTGAETNYSLVAVCAKVASGPKATLAILQPRNLPILESGTAGAGAAGTITLASGTYTGLNLAGCFIRTTGGTGGGGTGGANNQARRITSYNTGTRVATVTPNWETTPNNTTTYDVLLPEGILVPMLTALAPTTLARTLDVSSGGEAGLDWANVGTPGSTVSLSATTVATVTTTTTASAVTTVNGLAAGVITAASFAAGAINAAAIATGAIDADALAADATTEIQSGLATAAQINSLAVNTRANLQVPVEIETPDASTLVYKIRLHLFDVEGNMEAPDSTPTIALTNAAGTDRSGRLSIASNPSTGVYTWDYTATAGDAEEQLVWVFTVVEGGLTRTYPATSYVVEESAYRFSSTDRATLNAAATAAELAKVPKSDGTATWNATALASIQQEATDALNAYDPPTNAEMEARTIVAANYATAANLATVAGYLDTEIASIITAIADVPTVAEFEARTIVAASYSTLTAAQVWALSDGVETGVTPKQALQRIGATTTGKASGIGTGTEVYVGMDGSTTRVTVTLDGSNNRTSVVYA